MRRYALIAGGGFTPDDVIKDGVTHVTDISCAGTTRDTGTQLPSLATEKMVVRANYVDGSNYALVLPASIDAYDAVAGMIDLISAVEIFADGGTVVVFPSTTAVGSTFQSGVASVSIPDGTGRSFRRLHDAGGGATTWAYMD